MDKDKYVALAGSQRRLAKILGISEAAVCQWKPKKDGSPATMTKKQFNKLKTLKPEWFAEA